MRGRQLVHRVHKLQVQPKRTRLTLSSRKSWKRKGGNMIRDAIPYFEIDAIRFVDHSVQLPPFRCAYSTT